MMLHKIIDIDKNGLLNLQNETAKMEAKMKIAAKQICKELSEYGLNKMQEIYNGYELTGSEPSSIYMEGTDTEKKLIMQGPQAIYDEFGTGTLGEISPHPIKDEFNLRGYNTGPTIRPATQKDIEAARKQGVTVPLGMPFWTYTDGTGQRRYTQGTPAQREVYDSVLLTTEKSPEVIKKIMKEVVFKDD